MRSGKASTSACTVLPSGLEAKALLQAVLQAGCSAAGSRMRTVTYPSAIAALRMRATWKRLMRSRWAISIWVHWLW